MLSERSDGLPQQRAHEFASDADDLTRLLLRCATRLGMTLPREWEPDLFGEICPAIGGVPEHFEVPRFEAEVEHRTTELRDLEVVLVVTEDRCALLRPVALFADLRGMQQPMERQLLETPRIDWML